MKKSNQGLVHPLKEHAKDEVNEMLMKAIELLPGKILGYDDLVGVYELGIVSTGSTSREEDIRVVCHQKHEMDREGGENYMRFSLVSRHLRWLQGEILTVLEATIDDDRKLNATKQLVKDKISAKISWIYEQCGIPTEQDYALSDTEE